MLLKDSQYSLFIDAARFTPKSLLTPAASDGNRRPGSWRNGPVNVVEFRDTDLTMTPFEYM